MSTRDYNYVPKSQDHNAYQLPNDKSKLQKSVLFKEGFYSLENAFLRVFRLHHMELWVMVGLKRFLKFFCCDLFGCHNAL